MNVAGQVVLGAPSAAYLWIPIGTGGGLAISFALIIGVIGIPCGSADIAQQRQRDRFYRGRFWKSRIYASAGWTFGDSGATNITALATAVVAILTADSALNEVFGNVDLNPFIIMNTACGGLAAAGPIVFAIFNYFVTRKSLSVPVDAALTLQADATITFPAGASITLPGGATVAGGAGQAGGAGAAKSGIKPGTVITVPAGSTLTILAGAVMSVPSGAALAVRPGGTLRLDTAAKLPADALVPAGQAGQESAGGIFGWLRHAGSAGAKKPDVPSPELAAGDLIMVTEGAAVAAAGAADIVLPKKTTVAAPGRRLVTLQADETLTVPCGSSVLTASMLSVLPAALLTTFAAGTEVGLVTVLAAHYSTAGPAGHDWAVGLAAVVGTGLLMYAVTAILSLTKQTPGTALSSEASSSFTL
jgi:hypothetical protein